MSSSSKLTMFINVVAVSSLLFVTLWSVVDAGISCDDVKSNAKPCMGYAKGKGDENTVPPKCCDGMRSLSVRATTAEDKTAVCNCLKPVFGLLSLSLDENRLNQIPTKCNVVVPFKLSKNLDCNNIK